MGHLFCTKNIIAEIYKIQLELLPFCLVIIVKAKRSY
jgi:hypothetical protein